MSGHFGQRRRAVSQLPFVLTTRLMCTSHASSPVQCAVPRTRPFCGSDSNVSHGVAGRRKSTPRWSCSWWRNDSGVAPSAACIFDRVKGAEAKAAGRGRPGVCHARGNPADWFVEAVAGTRTLVIVTFRPKYDAAWMRKSFYLKGGGVPAPAPPPGRRVGGCEGPGAGRVCGAPGGRQRYGVGETTPPLPLATRQILV